MADKGKKFGEGGSTDKNKKPPPKPDPEMLGSGFAERAGKSIKGRQAQIDDAVDAASHKKGGKIMKNASPAMEKKHAAWMKGHGAPKKMVDEESSEAGMKKGGKVETPHKGFAMKKGGHVPKKKSSGGAGLAAALASMGGGPAGPPPMGPPPGAGAGGPPPMGPPPGAGGPPPMKKGGKVHHKHHTSHHASGGKITHRGHGCAEKGHCHTKIV